MNIRPLIIVSFVLFVGACQSTQAAPSRPTLSTDGGEATLTASDPTAIGGSETKASPDEGRLPVLGGPRLPGAPNEVAQRELLPYCGAIFVVPTPHLLPGLTEEGSIDCLIEQAASGLNGELIVVRPTPQGDPVVSVFRIFEGSEIEILEDSTRDTTGGGRWTRRHCADFEPAFGTELFEWPCAEPTTLVEPGQVRVDEILSSLSTGTGSDPAYGVALDRFKKGPDGGSFEQVITIESEWHEPITVRVAGVEFILGWYKPSRSFTGGRDKPVVLQPGEVIEVDLELRSPVSEHLPPGVYTIELVVESWRDPESVGLSTVRPKEHSFIVEFVIPDQRRVDMLGVFCDAVDPAFGTEGSVSVDSISATARTLSASASLLEPYERALFEEKVGRLAQQLEVFLDDSQANHTTVSTGEVVLWVNETCGTNYPGYGITE